MTPVIQATPRPGRRSNLAQMFLRRAEHICGLAYLLVAGCTAPAEEVRPPDGELYFPTGLAISPAEDVLFAVSANSDLQYDSGTLLAFDLAEIDEVIAGWLGDDAIPSRCERDPVFSETLVCKDSPAFVVPGAGVRIGNFATGLSIQDHGDGNLRLIVPVRGDPSVTWVDWSDADRVLDCSDAAGFPLCDASHRLTRFFGDDDFQQINEEPYGAFADGANGYAMITHLTSGTVTLLDSQAGEAPVLVDVLSGLFQSDPVTGVRGSTAVAGRTPGVEGDVVYVTSRSENRVQTFTVARSGDQARLVPSSYFFLDRVGTNSGASSDTRGLVFGSGGDRGYFMNREPPSLAVVDSSLGVDGFPRNLVIGGTDLCREASSVAVADLGEGERVFVTCFTDGEVYVIDPRGGVDVEAIATVGRGPFGVAVSATRHRLYVTNFFENSIAVIDLTPGAPTQYRVVLRIAPPEDQ